MSLRLLFLFLFIRRGFARADEVFYFGHELGDVFELQIDGREADVGDLVEGFKAAHDDLADVACTKLAVEGILDVLFDLIDDGFELASGDRAFFGGAEEAGEDFVTVPTFAFAVFFDDHIWNFVDAFVGSESPAALQTFAAAADGITLARFPRIHDLIFHM